MDPINVYKFCPKCGGGLEVKKENLLVCRKCGFKFYISALPCNAAIVENERGEILLVKRKLDPGKGFWDLPGGFLDGGESLEDSVKREIKEELQVEGKMGKIIGIYEDKYLFQGINYPILTTVVSASITSEKLHASDDIESFSFVPKEEVLGRRFAFASITKGISDYLLLKV